MCCNVLRSMLLYIHHLLNNAYESQHRIHAKQKYKGRTKKGKFNGANRFIHIYGHRIDFRVRELKRALIKNYMILQDGYGSSIKLVQDTKGFIVLRFGLNGSTRLTKKQIEELGVRSMIYSAEVFDQEKYNEAYWEGVWGLFEKDTEIIIDTSMSLETLQHSAEKFIMEDIKDGNSPDLYEIRKIYQHY